jgi:transporter family protein
MHNWLPLSFVSLVFWGLTGVTQKLSTNNISFRRSFVWFAVAFGMQAGLIAVFLPLDWRITPSLIALAALGGLLNGLGVLTSFLALERGGKASVVVALVSIYPLLTIAGAWLFLGEKLSVKQTAGVFCALVAIVLLAQESAPKVAAAIERHEGG